MVWYEIGCFFSYQEFRVEWCTFVARYFGSVILLNSFSVHKRSFVNSKINSFIYNHALNTKVVMSIYKDRKIDNLLLKL